MEHLNISHISTNIASIKNPLVFLFRLYSYKDDINDSQLSIIFRIFIKYHSHIFFTYNIKLLFNDLPPKTWNVIDQFYKLINKKIILLHIIKTWKDVYNNVSFWNLNIFSQIEFLRNLEHQFFSIYDCSKGGVPYYLKLISFRNTNYPKHEVYSDAVNRLTLILKMFGVKVFKSLEIPLFNINDFYDAPLEIIVGYFITIYEKFSELLNQTITLFDTFNLNSILLDNLINPILLNINSSIIDSDTDMDDINLFLS